MRERTRIPVFIRPGLRTSICRVAADEWEALQETRFWLSQPDIREDLAEAQEARDSGSTMTGEELRQRYGLGPR